MRPLLPLSDIFVVSINDMKITLVILFRPLWPLPGTREGRVRQVRLEQVGHREAQIPKI